MRKRMEHGQGFSVIPTPYEVEAPRISECPTSYVTQHSLDLVQIAVTMKTASDLSGLPGSIVDALRITSGETKAADVAMDDAITNA